MNFYRFGLILTIFFLADFCFAQSKSIKDIEYKLHFSSDSGIRLSKDENLELFNAVKNIVNVDVAQNEYPVFKMRIWCKVNKNGEIISINVKSLNFDTKEFIEKDIKSLFCRIKRFKISGMTLKREVTNIIFILKAQQDTNEFIFVGGFSRPES